MDFLKNLTDGDKKEGEQQHHHAQSKPKPQEEEGGIFDKIGSLAGGAKKEEAKKKESSSSGGFMDKINSLAGGGKKSEANEDGLDKGVDWVQEHVLGKGKQDNESAIEQAKDEQISDFIRGQYKGATGKEFPIADKEH